MVVPAGYAKLSRDSATISFSECNLSTIIHPEEMEKKKKTQKTTAYWHQIQVGAPVSMSAAASLLPSALKKALVFALINVVPEEE